LVLRPTNQRAPFGHVPDTNKMNASTTTITTITTITTTTTTFLGLTGPKRSANLCKRWKSGPSNNTVLIAG